MGDDNKIVISETAYGDSSSSIIFLDEGRKTVDVLYSVESHGYFAEPTKLSEIPFDQVFMCCVKIEKNSNSPGIYVSIQD